MNKYGIIIYWSEEDKVFIAEVPELPGCMTHGDTRTTALANAKKAIQAWIHTAKKFGDPIPKPKGESVTSNKFAEVKHSPVIGGDRLPARSPNPRTFSYANAMQRPTVNPEAR
jgi:predicted RNase H-like HicB family nuclease